MKKKKTYRAIRHQVVRDKQNKNSDSVHHPDMKINQIIKVIDNYKFHPKKTISILELFAGRGNCTKIYNKYGKTKSYDKKYLGTGDSYIQFHSLIGEKAKFDIIDLDPYGFPNRFFPDIFLLITKGIMFITMPKPAINILNGITRTHLISYYNEHNPSEQTIVEKIALFGLCHWRKVELVNVVSCKSIWRFAFEVEKIKATEYAGVKNRADAYDLIKVANNQLTLF